MFSVKLIRSLCGIAIALNIILPIMDKPKFTIFIISQIVAILLIHVYALMNVTGAQSTPIVATFVVRALQSLVFIAWRQDMTWISMGILVFIDILLIVLLILDKSNYEYVFLEEVEDEFSDTYN